MLDIEDVCSQSVKLALGSQWQAGYAHLFGQLARPLGIKGAAQEQPDLGGLRMELVGQVLDAMAVPE